jgi:hypothetical protein
MDIKHRMIVFDAADLEAHATAHDRALTLGARLLKPADDAAAPRGVQVYADPAGHPFCLCWAPG